MLCGLRCVRNLRVSDAYKSPEAQFIAESHGIRGPMQTVGSAHRVESARAMSLAQDTGSAHATASANCMESAQATGPAQRMCSARAPRRLGSAQPMVGHPAGAVATPYAGPHDLGG